jgi:hypothetical protein
MGDGDGDENHEYAELVLIVTKVIKVPPKRGKVGQIESECAYIDGLMSNLYNTATVKIDMLTAGNYIVFYKADFSSNTLCRKLNTVFMSPHEVPLKRISAKRFGKEFLDDLRRRNFARQQEPKYKQPIF